MNLNNKMISTPQCFRMGILENITLGMVVIPYITVNLAGKWHFVALLIGLIFAAIYMTIIYFFSQSLPRDLGDSAKSGGLRARGLGFLYAIRFLIRAGVVMLFFGKTVQEFLLQSYSLWVIVIVFAIVCGYGASRDIEKRGRMLELLYPWMIVPIILVAVFSVSSINIEELYAGLRGMNYEMIREGVDGLDVLKAGYVAFLVLTSTELMMFSLPYQKESNWRSSLKTGIWILVSVFFAYVFIIGILGGHWVASDAQQALNVMEAAFIPGEVIERADYPVLAFWIIGVFAIVSGYMFYAKEALIIGVKPRHKKGERICLWLIMIGVVIMTLIWSQKLPSLYLAKYMLFVDVIISLLIPLLIIGKLGKVKIFSREMLSNVSRTSKGVALFIVIALGALAMTGCDMDEEFKPIGRNQGSVEDRDYVTKITFVGDEEIVFTVADIKKYLSDATGDFETKEERIREDSLDDAMEDYYETNGRNLDLGHLSAVTFSNVLEDDLREYVLEMSQMPQMGKSVTVTIDGKNEMGQEESQDISLRQLIKKAYAGENLP